MQKADKGNTLDENPKRSVQGVKFIRSFADAQDDSIKFLLPLDGCAWLRREVVAYAVHIRNFCEDAVGDLEKYWPVDLLDDGSHRVDGVHGADDHRPVV